MTNILIRADASLLIGSGHVIRCLTLARELHRRGANVRFLCRRQPGDLIDLIEEEFTVLVLPEQPLASTEKAELDALQGRDLYDAWLGCSQEQDASDCLHALRHTGLQHINWLVVDHYGLDESWESQVVDGLSGDLLPKLLVIDDLADRQHQADCLLDQNFFGSITQSRYEYLVPQHCRQLLGPYYALLGPEYAQLHPLVPPRTEFKRVLVFFGGVDSANLTSRTLQALMDPTFADFAVDVVLGRQSTLTASLAELVNQLPQATLHRPLPSLAGLIMRADLAIGAAGTTTWERACLRLPSLLIATAANQLDFAEALNKAGHLHLLGVANDVTVENIRSALRDLDSILSSQEAGSTLVDGWGAKRIAIAMLGTQGKISLRPAAATDQISLLHWPNKKKVIAESYPYKEKDDVCEKSFPEKFLDELLLIATESGGCPIGKICFYRQFACAEGNDIEVTVDFALDRCALIHGLSAELVRLGTQVAEQLWGPASKPISGNLFRNNACFIRSSFELDPDLIAATTSTSTAITSESLELALGASRITVLSDGGSWLNDYLPGLITSLWQRGHSVRWIHEPAMLSHGDVSLLLSCSNLLSVEELSLHSHNLVVHESDLPQGKGWSPMTWQILEGVSIVPATLFEASTTCDAGLIYLQREIFLQGNELVSEWRDLQAHATLELCISWFDNYHEIVASAKQQRGKSSYYKRRQSDDSMLDPERSIADQFNLLRVVDNQNYPAYFTLRDRRYSIKVNVFPKDLPSRNSD